MIKSFKKFWKDWKGYCDVCSILRKDFHKKHLFGEIVFSIVYVIVLIVFFFGMYISCITPQRKKDLENNNEEE